MKIVSTQVYNTATVLIGILAVGYIDYLTGLEIRIFPLYFLPLARAATVFSRTAAVAASIFAATTWILAQYLSGREYSSSYIWGVNFVTQGIAFVLVTTLIASLRTALARERALSRTDPLTGLFNSRALYEIAGAELTLCHRNKRPAALAFIDLDNFKQVNDSFGHGRGDTLLRNVANLLTNTLRSTDVIARVGGDEFAIFLPEIEAHHAHTLLEKIRMLLQQFPDFEDLPISASIGAVAYANAPSTLQDMMKEADAHMYTVKAAGKNRVNVKSSAHTGDSANA